MTKQQELDQIEAELRPLKLDAEREREIIEASCARMDVIAAKMQRLTARLDAVLASKWE